MIVSNAASIDVTTLFKSCVKTIRTRNKAIGITFPQSKILPTAPTTQFFVKSRDIQANIASHDRLLCEHRKKYLNDSTASFSDIERAYMEKVISRNLKFIEDNIRNLELEIKESLYSSFSGNAKECQHCVINILRANYLRTSATFRDMKDQRQKKQREKEQLFRLQRPSSLKKQLNIGEEKSRTNLRQRKSSEKHHVENLSSTNYKRDRTDVDTSLREREQDSPDGCLEDCTKATTNESSSSPHQSTFLEEEMESSLRDLDEEERQLLEEENAHLYNELMSNKEEVKQITKQVVELSRMQDILTENVEIQTQEIEEIHDTILHATDNVQRGNEQVREAMRKDAGFRVWIMFFLIVMSFTILFLDWYSP